MRFSARTNALASALQSAIRAVSQPLSAFMFPPACLACGTPLDANEPGVCAPCLSRMTPIESSGPLFQDTRERLLLDGSVCDLCACYVFEKEGPLQQLVHQLKYNGMTRVGVELGRLLGRRLQLALTRDHADGIIPVPLHAVKRRERGYNQAEYICRGIGLETGLPILRGVLARRRNTATQTALNIRQREENVAEAFAVRPASVDLVRDRRFLLVDDVITTGATMRACAAALTGCEAKPVIACAVALATYS